MIEVFKTNVTDRKQAAMLVEEIANAFADHVANFDLQDCDKILRVECATGVVKSFLLIKLLREQECEAEILSEDQPAIFTFENFQSAVSKTQTL